MYQNKKINAIIILIFGFSILFFISIILLSNLIIYSDKNATIFLDKFIETEDKSNLNYRLLNTLDKKLYVYETIIKKDDFLRIDNKNQPYKLIIYRLACHWYKVYINEIVVASLGALENDSSVIWNTIKDYNIDPKLLKDENRIKLEFYSTYEIGYLAFSPIITTVKHSNTIMNWFSFFLINFYIIAIGILWFCFALLVLLLILIRTKKREYIFYSLSTIFSSFYIFDNIIIYDLVVPTLLFKLFVFSSLYFSITLFSFALFIQFKKKLNLFLGVLLLGAIFLMLLLSRNMILLKKITNIFNLFILLNIVGWIITAFISFKKSNDAKIILSSSIFLSIVSMYDIFFILFEKAGRYNILSINIYGIIFFSLAIILLIIFDYIEIFGKIACEKERADHYYERSIRDSMTGAYNFQHTMSIIKELHTPFSVIMIDTDHFKSINDTYGHDTGDSVIHYIVEKCRNCIRTDDLVCRYGGDEFIVVLSNCDEYRAIESDYKITNFG